MKAKVTLTLTIEDSAFDNGTLDKEYIKENFHDLIEDSDCEESVDDVEIIEPQKDAEE